jgi:hypothetical protein
MCFIAKIYITKQCLIFQFIIIVLCQITSVYGEVGFSASCYRTFSKHARLADVASSLYIAKIILYVFPTLHIFNKITTLKKIRIVKSENTKIVNWEKYVDGTTNSRSTNNNKYLLKNRQKYQNC